MTSSASPSLLLVACGDIGSGVARHFVNLQWQVSALRRRVDALPGGVTGIAADLCDETSMGSLTLQADYVVITLTPQSYTAQGYDAVFRDGLRRVLAAMAKPPKALVFVSSTGVYNQSNHEWVDETSVTAPSRFSGRAILDAEQLIADYSRDNSVDCSIVRFSGIYGPGREQMLKKVLAGQCAPAQPQHYSNRIHRDDAVGFLCHLLGMAQQGAQLADCYLASDSAPALIQDVQSWLAHTCGVAYRCDGEPVTRTGSKRCSNRRMLATGYELRYPDFRAGYQEIIGG